MKAKAEMETQQKEIDELRSRCEIDTSLKLEFEERIKTLEMELACKLDEIKELKALLNSTSYQ